jgi:hypothetical protein
MQLSSVRVELVVHPGSVRCGLPCHLEIKATTWRGSFTAREPVPIDHFDTLFDYCAARAVRAIKELAKVETNPPAPLKWRDEIGNDVTTEDMK